MRRRPVPMKNRGQKEWTGGHPPEGTFPSCVVETGTAASSSSSSSTDGYSRRALHPPTNSQGDRTYSKELPSKVDSDHSSNNEGDSDDESPTFFEPEDLFLLGKSAVGAAGAVTGAVGAGLGAVKKKWADNEVGKRVVGAVGLGALACSVGKGWNTLSDAADFWLDDGVNTEESSYHQSLKESSSSPSSSSPQSSSSPVASSLSSPSPSSAPAAAAASKGLSSQELKAASQLAEAAAAKAVAVARAKAVAAAKAVDAAAEAAEAVAAGAAAEATSEVVDDPPPLPRFRRPLSRPLRVLTADEPPPAATTSQFRQRSTAAAGSQRRGGGGGKLQFKNKAAKQTVAKGADDSTKVSGKSRKLQKQQEQEEHQEQHQSQAIGSGTEVSLDSEGKGALKEVVKKQPNPTDAAVSTGAEEVVTVVAKVVAVGAKHKPKKQLPCSVVSTNMSMTTTTSSQQEVGTAKKSRLKEGAKELSIVKPFAALTSTPNSVIAVAEACPGGYSAVPPLNLGEPFEASSNGEPKHPKSPLPSADSGANNATLATAALSTTANLSTSGAPVITATVLPSRKASPILPPSLPRREALANNDSNADDSDAHNGKECELVSEPDKAKCDDDDDDDTEDHENLGDDASGGMSESGSWQNLAGGDSDKETEKKKEVKAEKEGQGELEEGELVDEVGGGDDDDEWECVDAEP